MGRFGGVPKARVGGGGSYFDAIPLPLQAGQTEQDRNEGKYGTSVFGVGRYVVRVEVIKAFLLRDDKTNAFVLEAEVLESNHPGHQPGTTASYYTDDSYDSFSGNVKHVVSVVTDTDPADVDEAGCEMVCDEKNPFQGTIIQVEAKMKLTRAKSLFTVQTFKPATPEQLAKYSKTAPAPAASPPLNAAAK